MPHELIVGNTGDDRSVHLVLDGKQHLLGRIVKTLTIYSWQPVDPMPFGLNIRSNSTFSLSALIDLLEHCVDRQLTAHFAGEPIDPCLLHPDLRPYLNDIFIRHPFSVWVYHKQNIADTNFAYKRKRKDVASAKATKDFVRFIALHQRPYRLDAFLECVEHLDDRTYWQMLANIWIDSENIFENLEHWIEVWSSDRPGREQAMDEDERKALAKMPEVIHIYRGSDRSELSGISWSTNRAKAIWFAKRYPRKQNWLATATVCRDKVTAYFTGRNEFEIVVLPKNVESYTSRQIW